MQKIIFLHLFLVLIAEGEMYPLPANFQKRGVKSQNSLYTSMCLQEFAYSYGDKMPDQEKTHLPSCFTKGDIYKRLKAEAEEVGDKVCSESHFKRLWRDEEPNITIPKVHLFLSVF